MTCAIVKAFKCKVIGGCNLDEKKKKATGYKLIGTLIHLREEHVKSHFVLVCFPVIVLTPAWSRSSEPAVMNPPPCSINITCTKDTGRRKAGDWKGGIQTPSKDEYRKTGKLLWPCAICLLTCRFTYVWKKEGFPCVVSSRA